jgi:hypothetical protein
MKADNAKKALVSLAIEQTLLQMGGVTLMDKISDLLFKEYKSYIPDCYEHPEYLNKVLKKLFGNSYTDVVRSIRKELDDFANQEPISDFLERIAE